MFVIIRDLLDHLCTLRSFRIHTRLVSQGLPPWCFPRSKSTETWVYTSGTISIPVNMCFSHLVLSYGLPYEVTTWMIFYRYFVLPSEVFLRRSARFLRVYYWTQNTYATPLCFPVYVLPCSMSIPGYVGRAGIGEFLYFLSCVGGF